MELGAYGADVDRLQSRVEELKEVGYQMGLLGLEVTEIYSPIRVRNVCELIYYPIRGRNVCDLIYSPIRISSIGTSIGDGGWGIGSQVGSVQELNRVRVE